VATFPGYALPAELIALRDQIRRIVRDDLLPIEHRIDNAGRGVFGRYCPPVVRTDASKGRAGIRCFIIDR
jgi:hypothetical protein